MVPLWIAAAGAVEDFTVTVGADLSDLGPETIALGGKTDVLRRVETEAVNADSGQASEVVENNVLHILMTCVEVRHTDFTVGNLITVVPVGYVELGVPVRAVLKVVLDVGVIAREVVGNDVADNLNAVLLRRRAKRRQLVLGAQRAAGAVEFTGQIQTVPLSEGVRGLHGRCLHGGEARRRNVGEFRLDVGIFPVEAMEDVAVLNVACQAVAAYGAGVRRSGNAVVRCACRCGSKAADCHA